MSDNKRVVGEDKLSRLIRALKGYESQLQMELREKIDVSITLQSEGFGCLQVVAHDKVNLIYNFENTDLLFEFLESGQLKRMMMVRG